MISATRLQSEEGEGVEGEDTKFLPEEQQQINAIDLKEIVREEVLRT
jgi:hypothetical protein